MSRFEATRGERQAPGVASSVLLVAATEAEATPLARRIAFVDTPTAGPVRVREGRLGPTRVGLVITGVGKANGAMGTALALGRFPADLVLCLGVAGAFPGSGLEVGAVAVASEERYGDEGVETDDGFLDLAGAGLSFGVPGGESVFGVWPTRPEVATALVSAAGGAPTGPFVTVSTVTGTDERARALVDRTGALCESMEGAAVAQAAAAHGVAFAELRGVSNPVGHRDRDAWRIGEAAEAACGAVLAWLDSRVAS